MKVFLLGLLLLGYHARSQNAAALKPLNIDYKNRAYCYAASPELESTSGFGGWGGSNNNYQRIQSKQRFPEAMLSVTLRTDEPAAFYEKYAGIALYVANTGTDTLFFNAQDSRLNLKMQAFHNGQWKDIEYLPSSWCGNSYHMVYLPIQTYWTFTVPRYIGKIKTRLRVALEYKSSLNGELQWVYSNEVEGSVNMGQFSKLPKYESMGIMDPYDN